MSANTPTTLLRISLDVLVLIAERLDGVDLLILTKTCPKLQRSLFNDAKLTLLQVCARKSDKRVRLPPIISHLPYLTHLSLCLGNNTTVGPLSHYLTQPLPRTLQLLRLQFREAEKLFAMSPLETAMVCYMRYPEKQYGESISDLNGAFPHLHTLELHGEPSICDTHVSNLPSTLTRLSFGGMSLSNSCLGELPRGLNFLRIYNSRELTDEGFPSLPPNLETLELISLSATKEIFQLLPPSIKRFICKSELCILPSSTLADMEPSTHASSSTTRKGPTPRRTTAGNRLAPPLQMSSNSKADKALDPLLLPRGLQNLSISLKNCTTLAENAGALSQLPSGLTKLKLTHTLLSPAAITSLPKTLRSLSASSTKEWLSQIAADQWPEELIKLAIFSAQDADPPLRDYTVKWPANLRSLRLGQHVHTGWLCELPKSLTKLCLSNCAQLKKKEIRGLPRGLHSLLLFNTPSKFLDTWIKALPEDLKRFYLHGNATLSKDAIQLLPRGLTEVTLALDRTTWYDSSMDLVPSLPPNLVHFGVSTVIKRPEQIPPNLIGLRLEGTPPFTLPQELVYFYGPYRQTYDPKFFHPNPVLRVLEPVSDSIHARNMLSPDKAHDHVYSFW